MYSYTHACLVILMSHMEEPSTDAFLVILMSHMEEPNTDTILVVSLSHILSYILQKMVYYYRTTVFILHIYVFDTLCWLSIQYY